MAHSDLAKCVARKAAEEDQMMKAEKGDQVVANFTVRTSDGILVSKGHHALTLGSGEAFFSIEKAVIGMSEGEEKTIIIPSHEAFGPRLDDLVVCIPRSKLPSEDKPAKGMQLVGENDLGEAVQLTVTEVTPNSIIADGNHPLAGLDLHVLLALVKIEDAK